MTNIIFSEYPYWLTEDSWYEVIPPKGKMISKSPYAYLVQF